MVLHKVRIEPLGVVCQVPHGSPLQHVLRSYDVEFPCGGKGKCGNCRIKLKSGIIQVDALHAALLEKKGLSGEWRMACMCKVEDDLVIEIPDNGMQIMTDVSTFDFEPEEGYGIAVDLGSTTIVVQLLDMASGVVLKTVSGINPQTTYGADIISRIMYALESEDNLMELKKKVREYIGECISSILPDGSGELVRKVIIAGNSVMHHLFAGYDVTPLAYSPFNSPKNGGYTCTAEELEWNLPDSCSIEFLPNISHFVGSDIIAGIQAVGMKDKDRYSLLIDLGTNGEMALGSCKGIICTSTAAGPAFEGINISCGMRASIGAIYAMEYADSGFRCMTIGGAAPAGLCGSGLVEAVHTLLENGFIDFTGAMTDDSMMAVELCDGVRLKIEDIREFQLAKAALAAGIRILLKQGNVDVSEVENVYITGGLGNYLDVDKIKRLGLFTEFDGDKIVKVRNAAITGCRELLFDSNRKNVEGILSGCSFCSLENLVEFQNVFCEEMFFPM